MERAKDGDLERLAPARVFGRLRSSEKTGCRKHSVGSSTRTGRDILAHCLQSANWPGGGSKTRHVTSCYVTLVSRPFALSTTTSTCHDSVDISLSSSSTGITTSNTPVPHRIGRPNTKFPDGVLRSSKSPYSVASERNAPVVSNEAFNRGDGCTLIPLRLNGL